MLDTNERLPGPGHLLTLNSVNTVAVIFARTDNYVLAEPLYQRALEGKQRVQVSKHPETLLIMSHLADLLCKKGDYVQAEALMRKVVETKECEQGLNHLSTITSLENLADLLEKGGKLEESLTLRDRESAFSEWKIQPALDHLKTRLSPNAFDLLQTLATVPGDRKKLSDLERFSEWRDVQPLESPSSEK